MDNKQIFECIKDACLSEGCKQLLEDIKTHEKSSNTIQVMPVFDEQRDDFGKVVSRNLVSSTTDEMLKRQGYVQGLNTIIGWIEHYQNNEYQEDTDAV